MLSLARVSFRNRLLIIVGLACAICATMAFFASLYFQKRELRTQLVDKARTILSRMDAATEYIAQQGGLNSAIESTVQKYKGPKELSPEDKLRILKQVPIFAAMKIGAKDAEKEHYTFRVFSHVPRRKENTATPQELEVLKKFESDPSLKEQVVDDGKIVIVYHPVRLSEKAGCLNCHGNPAHSPWKNGEDVLGYQMENWADGELHGVFSITSDVAVVEAATEKAQTLSTTQYLVLWIGLGAVLALIVAAWLVRGPIGAFTKVALRLGSSGEELRAASDQLSSASQQVSTGTSNSAASLEETAASIEELSGMVQLNADHAKEASALSQKSTDSAGKGETEITSLIQAMSLISSSSKKIEEIITVMDDIAFQTNLLALNAAVEAARAGEQGKGFAVVAEAVRSLAQRSASAAKDISALIKESVVQIERGAKVADSSGEVLREIVSSVKKVASLNAEIAKASAEQSKGLSEISKAMAELDSSTQSNAAASEEVAATAERMSHQSEIIRGLVRELETVIDGLQDGEQAHRQPDVSGNPEPIAPPLPFKPKPAMAKKAPSPSSEEVIPFGNRTGTNGP